MHSPHLVGLLGYCADQSHRLLVFELMPNGTLKSHLHRPAAVATDNQEARSPALDCQTRLCIALDCARALEFLHEHTSPAVIHNYRAWVSDFATTKVGSNKANGQVLTRVLGTTGLPARPFGCRHGRLLLKPNKFACGKYVVRSPLPNARLGLRLTALRQLPDVPKYLRASPAAFSKTFPKDIWNVPDKVSCMQIARE
ncbi:hypothetical protein QYE76_015260 [Lolium multiflorum]|uniref:Protein kinase domain-containing protein n=1 Tax=Lolium multiflorum TaxID=4521 RepID=A0AAD8U6H1_LOLMU|nr:hypothetical protein QYE76_015260 [Lolium multiflorum]